MRRFLAMGLVIGLCGCSATGAQFKDHPASIEPVPEQTARVVIYRITSRHYIGGGAPRLRLDGSELGRLLEKGFIAKDVSPGTHKLAVDADMTPGNCNLQIEMPAGETWYFLVAARGQNMAAMLPGALFAWGSLGQLVAGEAALVAGGALESAGKPCGGAYALQRILPNVAQAMLPELRESVKKQR